MPGNLIRTRGGAGRAAGRAVTREARPTARAKVNRVIIIRHAPSMLRPPTFSLPPPPPPHHRPPLLGARRWQLQIWPRQTANNNGDSCLLLRASICSRTKPAAYRQPPWYVAPRISVMQAPVHLKRDKQTPQPILKPAPLPWQLGVWWTRLDQMRASRLRPRTHFNFIGSPLLAICGGACLPVE